MSAQMKLGIGGALTTLGAVVVVVGPSLGLGSLGRPGDFVAGFVAGVAVGAGVGLVIAGLLARRAS